MTKKKSNRRKIFNEYRESNKHDIGGFLSNIGSKLDGWNTNLTDKFLDSGIGKGLSSFGIKAGGLGGIANTAATAIGGALAGGRSTAVGNVMQKVGSLASNIPGVGGLIGAGVNLGGGLVNAAIGSKLNAENIAAVEGDIKQALNFTSNAGDYDALASNYAGLQGVRGFDQDFIGKDGWIGGSKAKNKFNSLKTQAEEAEEHQLLALTDNAQNIADTNLQLMEANYTAYGGPINMKYTGVMSPFGNQFGNGGPKNSIPTQEEYITQQIAAKKASALERSRTRIYPRVPMSGTRMTKEEWLEDLNNREDDIRNTMQSGYLTPFLRNKLNSDLRAVTTERNMGYDAYRGTGEPLGSSCTATAFDNYGMDIISSELFRQNHKKHGFKHINNSDVQPSDIVIDVENGKGSHTMMLNSGTIADNNLRFNASNGGFEPQHIRKNAKYPFKGSMESYTFVGTPADSTQWINEYKEMYNKKAKGGPLKDSEFYSIMERVAKENYKNWEYDNEDEALMYLLNANDYDYKGYYNKYPKSRANADTHWEDDFKTVYHPTFSNESIYSGKKSKFNPEGLVGGLWDGETFIPADWQNKKAEGGNLFTNGVTTIDNGGTHEENPLEGVPMGIDQQGIPNLVEEGEVIYNDYVFSNRLRVPKAIRQKYKLRGTTFADAAKQLQKESEERPNDPISKNGLEAFMDILTQSQEEVRMKKDNNKYAKGGRLRNIFYIGGDKDSWLYKPVTEGFVPSKEDILGEMEEMYPYLKSEELSIAPIVRDASSKSTTTNNNKKSNLSYLRKAPVFMSGLAAVSDLFSNPDYSAADRVDGVQINPSFVKATPLGNYLSYRPLDREFYLNKLDANTAAGRRAVMNTSGGNRAAALAGILATDYNYGNQLGDLARKAEEYNQAQRERVEGFNRQTDMFNSEQSMKEQSFNTSSRDAATRLRLAKAQDVAKLRLAAKAAYDTRRSNNLNNFITNLGSLGQEETYKEWLDNLADKGVLLMNTSGEYVGKKKCKGGKLNRRR